jgi:hypothetical protein
MTSTQPATATQPGDLHLIAAALRETGNDLLARATAITKQLPRFTSDRWLSAENIEWREGEYYLARRVWPKRTEEPSLVQYQGPGPLKVIAGTLNHGGIAVSAWSCHSHSLCRLQFQPPAL